MEITHRPIHLPPSDDLQEAAATETVRPTQKMETARAASAPPVETAASPSTADLSRKGDFTTTGQLNRMQMNALLDEAKVLGEKANSPRDIVDSDALGGRIRSAITSGAKEGLAENFGLGQPGGTAPAGGGPAAIPGSATLLPGGTSSTQSADAGGASEKLTITEPLSGGTLNTSGLLGPLGEPPAPVGSESFAPSVRLRGQTGQVPLESSVRLSGQSGLPSPGDRMSTGPNTSAGAGSATGSSTSGTATGAATGRDNTPTSSGGGYFQSGCSVTLQTESSDFVDSEGNQVVATREVYKDNDTGATLEVSQTEKNGSTQTEVVLKDKNGKVVKKEKSTTPSAGVAAGMPNPEEGSADRGDLRLDMWALRDRLIGTVSQQLEPGGDTRQPFKGTITDAPVDPDRDPNPESATATGGSIPQQASVPGAGLIGGDPIGPDGSSGGSTPTEFRRGELPDDGVGDPRLR
jgi:hypothetical protein